jgi:hypothetical protein
VAPDSLRLSPADRAHALISWAQAWNLASDTGSLEPLALEAILDPGLVTLDATGTAARHGESWQDIQVGRWSDWGEGGGAVMLSACCSVVLWQCCGAVVACCR